MRAAPDLLASLKEVAQWYSGDSPNSEAWERSRCAIAKAQVQHAAPADPWKAYRELAPASSADVSNRDFAKCPKCGYEDQDSWEWFPEMEGTRVKICGNCHTSMRVEKSCTVTYTTRLLSPQNAKALPREEEEL